MIMVMQWLQMVMEYYLMANNDTIAEALDLTPLVPTRKDVQAIVKNEDYETAKGNMHNVIEVGTGAMNDLAEMAKLSQDPRVYRVLTELLDTMINANKELIQIKKTDSEIKRIDQKDDVPQTVNQNLIISTKELLELINKEKQ